MEAKRRVMLLVVLLVLTLLAGFLLSYLLSSITGKAILNLKEKETIETNYSYTKAICNEKDECIDIFIECHNGSVKNIKPTSDLEKFPDGWNDTRMNNEESFCK